MSLPSAPSDDYDPRPPVTLDSQGISIAPMTMIDDNDDVNCAFFSLNLSIYHQEVNSSDWDDTWFFLSNFEH
ncbi:hypothetical protein DM02DRAFT_663845 [Periconia macrospinosa]|uniref:Uncharacterized protein n=1 Tax=Periconia macrospinosa TaxID=97972 RepID=A0A2V1D0M4_9PLEO|nr:hypothetical protein DM02DRAFT_663845 [Periconia macrospinosa]